MPGFRKEFPDFPPASMPWIPPTWEDISWHNDACPCFDAGNGRLVYVDYADEAKREWRGAHRFTVLFDPRDNTEIRTLLTTDSWREVVALISGGMSLADIKAAVEAGYTVHWANTAYEVIKDSIGQWLVAYERGTSRACYWGLTHIDGVTVNGKPSEFFVVTKPR